MPFGDPEVIDVEDFHSILEGTKELQDLRQKCHLLDIDNRSGYIRYSRCLSF